MGVARRFRPPADHDACHEENGHGSPDRPAVALVLDHPAQIVGKATGYKKDGQDLDEIGQGRRIFIGMGGVGVRETAPVGAQHLDGHL